MNFPVLVHCIFNVHIFVKENAKFYQKQNISSATSQMKKKNHKQPEETCPLHFKLYSHTFRAAVLTSAAMKDRVCMPYDAPSTPQTTARLQQASSSDTSRQMTRTWLFMGVEGEKESCGEKKLGWVEFHFELVETWFQELLFLNASVLCSSSVYYISFTSDKQKSGEFNAVCLDEICFIQF